MRRRNEDSIPTRTSLLARLKDRDDQVGWKDFFDTYWKLIYGVAIKSGLSDAEAQDVVQETLITVARKIEQFKRDPALGSFKGWLCTVTRSKIVDLVRKRPPVQAPRPRPLGESERTPTIERVPDPASLDLDAVWEEDWRKNLMDAALEKIRPKVNPLHYQIFDLYVVKDWAARDVARTLKVNIGLVYLAKHRIAAMLKKEIENLEVNLT
ncbi:MAG: sigma-70 family RNA polymerase sigma factor [Verrucomicrobia bacterium]|nr:sigma-70 family RNA polymerase sigma factor [Verrucomicrobiota bacterium]